MKIRKATLNDLEEINRIYIEGGVDESKFQFPKKSSKQIIKEFERYSRERIKGFKKEIKDKNHYWIVYEEDKILAFGQAWIKNKSLGILEKIYVSKKARGKGIATKLGKELIKWLKNKKVENVECSLYWKNNPSRKLNEKLGFKPISLKMRLK